MKNSIVGVLLVFAVFTRKVHKKKKIKCKDWISRKWKLWNVKKDRKAALSVSGVKSQIGIWTVVRFI
jgi:hypothetical protein